MLRAPALWCAARQPFDLACCEPYRALFRGAVCTSTVFQAYRRGMEPPDRPEDKGAAATPQPDLVEQFLSEETMCSAEKLRLRLKAVSSDYQRFDGDTGSSEVQVARLTEKIAYMANHMQQHRKDFHSRRGLQGMLTRRRKLLQYLRRNDFDTYSAMLLRLGLRDNYAKQGCGKSCSNFICRYYARGYHN